MNEGRLRLLRNIFCCVALMFISSCSHHPATNPPVVSQPSQPVIVPPVVTPPPTPHPQPPPQTQPVPPPTDLVKDHTRWVSYGVYAILGEAGFDPNAFADNLGKSNFNAVSLHIRSPWNNNLGEYDVMYNPLTGAYDLSKANPKWLSDLTTLVDALWHNDIAVEICFVDQYGTPAWITGGHSAYPFKKHPWVNNIQHKVVDDRAFYLNWNRQNPNDPKNFYWMQWVTDAHDHVLQAKPTSPAGMEMMKTIPLVATSLFALHQKHPRGILRVRLVNEPWARCGDAHQGCDPAHDHGVDARTEDWMLYQFVSVGFKVNAQFRAVKNDAVYNLGSDWTLNLDRMAANYLWCLRHDRGWVFEIHGVDMAGPNSGITIEKYFSNYVTSRGAKYEPEQLELSTDGIKDAVVDAVSAALRKGTLAAIDAKPSDETFTGIGLNNKYKNQIQATDRNVFKDKNAYMIYDGDGETVIIGLGDN